MLLNIAFFYSPVAKGPFDIQGARGGGGAGIFPCDKLFFSLFLHNKLFFSKKNPSPPPRISNGPSLNTVCDDDDDDYDVDDHDKSNVHTE